MEPSPTCYNDQLRRFAFAIVDVDLDCPIVLPVRLCGDTRKKLHRTPVGSIDNSPMRSIGEPCEDRGDFTRKSLGNLSVSARFAPTGGNPKRSSSIAPETSMRRSTSLLRLGSTIRQRGDLEPVLQVPYPFDHVAYALFNARK